jgi:CDP-paratose 2-epimerase
MPTALITGSSGLVGSAAAARFARQGWTVLGVDNDQRQRFFGPAASTLGTRAALEAEFANYRHHDVDIRDEAAVGALFAEHAGGVDLIVHAAAQPSHDWAASAPFVDFQINATATLHLLEMTRRHCPAAVFVYTSTNKVYGDASNALPFVELDTRWELDPAHPYAARGIDESLTVDRSLHSLFGCSKLSADVMVQEYGRYFGLKTACFRCGCITGGNHAGVALHGFLAHLMRCAVNRQPYVVIGYQGKQVRDNLHADDLAAAIEAFYRAPRAGAVYNMGGGRQGSCSVREAVALAERLTGRPMDVSYDDHARKGDHIWWISDVSAFRRDYPAWEYRYDLAAVAESVHAGAVAAQSARG